jgi:hypothetical protein
VQIRTYNLNHLNGVFPRWRLQMLVEWRQSIDSVPACFFPCLVLSACDLRFHFVCAAQRHFACDRRAHLDLQ